MNNLSVYKYKNQIILHAIGVFFLCELISLLFLKFNVHFLYGLLLGTAIAVVNFNLLYFASRLLCKVRQGGFYLGFLVSIVRLLIYGFAFYTAIKIDYIAAFATALGFLTIKISIYFFNICQMIRNRIPKTK